MKFGIYLLLLFIYFCRSTVALPMSVTAVDSSFSNIDFKLIENISNSYDINYSNGLSAYHNIKNIDYFNYRGRQYYNFGFVGGLDANRFSMIVDEIESSPFEPLNFVNTEILTVPKLYLSLLESDMSAYYMNLFLYRPITSHVNLLINASGSVNDEGENTFSFVYRNTYENNQRVKFYSSENQNLNLNIELDIQDPLKNSIELYYDASFYSQDNFSWLLDRKDTLGDVYSYYDKYGALESEKRDSVYFDKMYNNLKDMQDSTYKFHNFGGKYTINRAFYEIQFVGQDNERANELGFFHNYTLGEINTKFSHFNMENKFSYIYRYNYLESSDFGQFYHHKNHQLKVDLSRDFGRNYLALGYKLDVDEDDEIFNNLNLKYGFDIFPFLKTSLYVGQENLLVDYLQTDSLDLRIPVSANIDLKREKKQTIGLNALSKYASLDLSVSRLENSIIPVFYNAYWSFNNSDEILYDLAVKCDLNIEPLNSFYIFANIDLSQKFYYKDKKFVNLALSKQTGKIPYKINLRLKKRFTWLEGNLIGNISAEGRLLSSYSQANFNAGGYNYSLAEKNPFIIEKSKIIYNLYTNLMFRKFILYLNLKNISNEIIYNDYGFRVNPLKLEWGFNWRLFN